MVYTVQTGLAIFARAFLFSDVFHFPSEQDDSCPLPAMKNMTCYCQYALDYQWEQYCHSQKEDPWTPPASLFSYKIKVGNADNGNTSDMLIKCNYENHFEQNMFKDIKLNSSLRIQLDSCPFPSFPIAEMFDLNSTEVSSLYYGEIRWNTMYSPPKKIKLHEFTFRGLEHSLKVVYLAETSLAKILLDADSFRDLTALHSITLQSYALENLPENLFDTQRELVELNIQRNLLTGLSDDTFSNLSKLQSLSLNDNKLTAFSPTIFHNLEMLTNLNLNGNNLVEIPPVLFRHLYNLKNLTLNENRLTSLSNDTFYYVTKLEYLDIGDNPFNDSLPSDLFSQLTSVNFIRLTNCRLTNLSEKLFSRAENLRELVLQGNQLQQVPSNIFKNNSKLRKVDLSGNNIVDLPVEVFTENKILEELDLSGNNLTTIPNDIFISLNILKKLMLHDNNLKDIEKYLFRGLEQLEVLNLKNNQIQVFDTLIVRSLRELDLSHNNIKSLSDELWMNIPNIVTLNMEHNELTFINIPPIRNKEASYTTLSFGYNKIGTVSVKNLLVNGASENNSLADATSKLLEVNFNPNPFSCDCNLTAFVSHMSGARKGYTIFGDAYYLKCATPESLAGQDLSSVPTDQFLCFFEPDCPEPCHCGRWSNGTSLVNCSKLKLTQLPSVIPFSTIVFNFTFNNITSIDALSKPLWRDVQEFYFDYNKIQSLHNLKNLPPNIKKLSLKGNDLAHFPAQFMTFSVNNLKLTLGDNLWNCDCSVLPFKLWLTSNSRKIEDFENVRCATPIKTNDTFERPAIATVEEQVICPLDTRPYRRQVISISTVVAMIGLLVFTVSVVYYRNRHAVIAYVYIHFGDIIPCCCQEEDLDEDKIYDAFISYSSADRDVAMFLLSELEEKEPKFKLCIHERDWMLGNLITDNIVASVQNSRRIILIISQEFLESVWFHVEFQVAFYQSLEDRLDRLIVIVKGEIPPIESLDKDLQFILEKKTYLVWRERWFVEKLRYAMPHKKNNIAKENDLRLNFLS